MRAILENVLAIGLLLLIRVAYMAGLVLLVAAGVKIAIG